MFTLNCNGRLVMVDKPLVMGIINVTPDSFYVGSRVNELDNLLIRAEKMLIEGATFLDIGAQSTRPGSTQVGVDEELERLVGFIPAIHKKFPAAIISVDTYHARVAAEAVAAGAAMVNDISGGNADPNMLATVGKLQVPYVCMHNHGTPKTMHQRTDYDDIILDIIDYFILRLRLCYEAGINDIIIDPGFGFSKNSAQNMKLLSNLELLTMLGKPILAGISRKSTIYKTLGVTAAEALNGSTVLNTICLVKGVSILRVHDVKEAVEAVTLVAALGV